MKKTALIAALVLLAAVSVFAQDAPRSWYVTPNGNDGNNGRSEENAFARLDKALQSAAASNVKTITIVGTVGGSYVNLENSGAGEILITGKDETADLGYQSSIEISGNSKVRFENVNIGYQGRLIINKGAVVTLGKGFKSKYETRCEEGGTLTAEQDAVLGNCSVRGSFLMKDSASIMGGGVGVEVIGTFAMQDTTKIADNKVGAGLYISGGTVVLKGNALITGNVNTRNKGNGGGITVSEGSLTIGDNVKITGNTATQGGGIYVGYAFSSYGKVKDITVTIKDTAEISGNKADQGGGIYFDGNEQSETDWSPYFALDNTDEEVGAGTHVRSSALSSVVLQGQAVIKDNTAKEGGGVYVKKGSAGDRITYTRSRDRSTRITKIEMLTGGFTMSGGSIRNNKADYGAGVYAEDKVQYKPLELDPSSSGTRTRQSGKAPVNVPAFNFTGGSITGNAAEFVGGGVYQKNAGAYLQGKGTLSGNTAGDGEGEDLYSPQG